MDDRLITKNDGFWYWLDDQRRAQGPFSSMECAEFEMKRSERKFLENATSLEMVEQFHRAFERPTDGRVVGREELRVEERNFLLEVAGRLSEISDECRGMGRGGEVAMRRLWLLLEEVAEVADALAEGDAVGCLNELCDVQYILDGTFLEFGFGKVKDEAMRRVHAANMSKLGTDGRPILVDGKVKKGPGYRPVELGDLVPGRAGAQYAGWPTED